MNDDDTETFSEWLNGLDWINHKISAVTLIIKYSFGSSVRSAYTMCIIWQEHLLFKLEESNYSSVKYDFN